MNIVPLPTQLLHPGDDLVSLLKNHPAWSSDGIVVISSKAVATVENAFHDLSKVTPSSPALAYAEKTGRSAAFMEVVLKETERLHGKVVGSCPGALLTEVQPEGMPSGTIFVANAGMDESNAPQNTAIGWPLDPVASTKHLWLQLGLPVLISDSFCIPRRTGVTAFAMTCAGINPLQSERGKEDLYGKTMRITEEALADQLAVSANMLMGNRDQSIPAALLLDHGIAKTDFCGWVPGIEPQDDLFSGVLR